MYRALVGTVWATIRTGAFIHHGQVTYSTLSGETKWSFWKKCKQLSVDNQRSQSQHSNWRTEHKEFSLPLTSRASCTQAEVFPICPLIVDTLMCSVWAVPCFKCSTFQSQRNYRIVLITQKKSLDCETQGRCISEMLNIYIYFLINFVLCFAAFKHLYPYTHSEK